MNSSSSTPSPSANSAPTTTPPTQQQHPDTEALARELAQLRAEMAKRTPSVEEELRREIAALRAAAGGDSSVAEHLAREAAYRREPHRAKLDRRRAKLEGYAAGSPGGGQRGALRREFATTARHQGVDPQDAVLLHCLLAPAPFRIRFARALLVNSAPAARAGFFNTLSSTGGPRSSHRHGPRLSSTCPGPCSR